MDDACYNVDVGLALACARREPRPLHALLLQFAEFVTEDNHGAVRALAEAVEALARETDVRARDEEGRDALFCACHLRLASSMAVGDAVLAALERGADLPPAVFERALGTAMACAELMRADADAVLPLLLEEEGEQALLTALFFPERSFFPPSDASIALLRRILDATTTTTTIMALTDPATGDTVLHRLLRGGANARFRPERTALAVRAILEHGPHIVLSRNRDGQLALDLWLASGAGAGAPPTAVDAVLGTTTRFYWELHLALVVARRPSLEGVSPLHGLPYDLWCAHILPRIGFIGAAPAP